MHKQALLFAPEDFQILSYRQWRTVATPLSPTQLTTSHKNVTIQIFSTQTELVHDIRINWLVSLQPFCNVGLQVSTSTLGQSRYKLQF